VHRIGVPHRGTPRQHQAGQPGLAEDADGWTRGKKDAKLKTDPHMVAWEDLPPDVADCDRNFVKSIPEMLAAVVLQIVDIHETSPRYPNHLRITLARGIDAGGVDARTTPA
jgi:hypothetical protein